MKKGKKGIEWGGEELRNKMLQLLRLQFLSFLFSPLPNSCTSATRARNKGGERKANFPLS